MRVGITYENGEVFQHFGHTRQFKLYDVENGEIRRTQIVDTNGQGHGALAGFLTQAEVDVLICGGIGGGAQTALKEAGIRLYGGVKGNADKAIKAYLKGNLDYNPEVHCTTHEHGHSCGEHHCGEEKHGCSGNGENQQEIKYFLWFFSKKSSGLMYLGLDVALATWYNKKQHGFIPKERTIYYETESWRTAFLGYDRVGK